MGHGNGHLLGDDGVGVGVGVEGAAGVVGRRRVGRRRVGRVGVGRSVVEAKVQQTALVLLRLDGLRRLLRLFRRGLAGHGHCHQGEQD